ncbi:hypothetical protein LCGC14_2822730 [marine sediment metagenome]|uniref:Mor transcription activator domain-containing protein n=1 Tax=marine sediment metagenome TaxID=412755 RepID=A0A0F9APZ6_9ZZZZ
MPYKNAREVLPLELLREVQKYVQGEQIYVPTKDEVRAKWGSKSGATEMIRLRNADICAKREQGHTVEQLAEMFYLSEESIRKILANSPGND